LVSYLIYNIGGEWRVYRWRKTPMYPSLDWVEYDDNWHSFNVESTKFRDIIKELKDLHPTEQLILKFDKHDEPIWSLYTIKKESDKNGN